ncbi:MAG: Leucine--tRNA ligase [Ignavibacteriaceae bacterium]|nr:Leucine--tRNA ligase [Ignavibacteriaceae bacterium]
MRYPFAEIEPRWQEYWEKNKVNKTDFSNTAEKLYTLVMFIYPSGAKLHCGHWYNYGPTDSWARYKKLRGYNVFEPMGYDAFGLPAENYAIKTGVHPQDSTMTNIADIRTQLNRIGCMYDWDAELMTCVPEYYKWNQWLFLQLYKKGLAYRKNAPVNWCPSCHTVLANEQVQADGTCERCGTTVIQKNLTQWFFRITDYAEELLSGLDTINWPEKTKLMQRNWIGKSQGAEIHFKVEGSDEKITVFTTRPDTIYGVTYVVLAPEHPLVDKIAAESQLEAIRIYRDEAAKLNEIDRTSTVREKTGVPIGAFAVNPVNGEKIPVWIADYALLSYGTGCVMAVPGHDERDFDFAKKFNLPIRKVILQEGTQEADELTAAYTETGVMVNSAQFNGMNSDEFKITIIDHLESLQAGKKRTTYRLRDWLISRQRYWGTPIPVVHCPSCGEVPVPEDQLPVELPYDIEFKPAGESPLASHHGYINTKCPKCGTDAKRDPDTMDTFVDSSWYYFRYLDPKFSDKAFNTELGNKWAPVDMYVGGAEHATMHLLYARFIHKFLRDIGMTNSDEPFQTLRHQGTITNNGAKMSKSKGNVVNPDEFIVKYGSDVFRMYLMFMGPYDMGGDWSDKGITGTDRFLQRSFDMVSEHADSVKSISAPAKFDITQLQGTEKNIYRKLNQTLKKYEVELEHFRFNTAIAALMELLNEIKEALGGVSPELRKYTLERYIQMLAPLAPHFGEEAWAMIGNDTSLFQKPVWSQVDESAVAEDTILYAVQVNGKLRATIPFAVDAAEEEVKSVSKADERVAKFIAGKEIVKEIFVRGKILNIVVK